jgi:hypothetical protein
MLGTVPKDKEIYANYIKSVDPATDDELETIQEVEEKGWTGFHMQDGKPILYDYHIKGFLKAAARSMNRVPESHTAKLKAFLKIIDGLVHVGPRRIALELPAGTVIGVIERPLRAQTAQGERVTLARSDTVPAGTRLTFTVAVLGAVSEAQLREWFEYGQWSGLGQWRNASYGRFTAEIS